MILTILGARPQFIKAAALSNSFREIGLEERIIHTGQHYDRNMSDVFFEELGIPGVYKNLQIGSGSHGAQTGQMLKEVEDEIFEIGDSLKALVVFGDTNSTIAGALAAAKLHVPIVHVEAGLRSYNRKMPEEVNRVLTDHLSNFLFCSSSVGVENLKKEGITRGVHDVGDIMQDSVNMFLPFAKEPADEVIKQVVKQPFNLMTVHRPANTDDGQKLQGILDGIGNTKVITIWPVHPRNNSQISKLNVPKNIVLTEPLSYFEMLYCLNKASQILTDSGGLQKEAYWLKTPCITIRPQTEWIETLHNNWNQLCEPNPKAIETSVAKVPTLASWTTLYRNGDAGNKIASTLQQEL